MSAEYDGRQVVGIELHRRRSVIVRMTETGERLDSVRLDNDPMVLAAEIAKAGESPQVVLEATYGWYWAVDVLREVEPVSRRVTVHPLAVRGVQQTTAVTYPHERAHRPAAPLPGHLRKTVVRVF